GPASIRTSRGSCRRACSGCETRKGRPVGGQKRGERAAASILQLAAASYLRAPGAPAQLSTLQVDLQCSTGGRTLNLLSPLARLTPKHLTPPRAATALFFTQYNDGARRFRPPLAGSGPQPVG